jgi:PAS domain-containing protein
MGTENLTSTPLDALLNAAVDAIVISDRNGLIIRVNPAAEKMFGYVKEDLQGEQSLSRWRRSLHYWHGPGSYSASCQWQHFPDSPVRG